LKTFFKLEEFENAGFAHRVDRNHLEKEKRAFQKRFSQYSYVIFQTEFSSNTNSKWQVIVALLKYSGILYAEKKLISVRKFRFQIPLT